MSDFRKLRVWQAAQKLVIDVYKVSRRMRGPQSRDLSDQLNRSTMSVPRNIIEGNEHESPRERKRFFGYALASVSEAEGHMQTCLDLEMIRADDFDRLVTQVVGAQNANGLLKGLDGDK
jgi:four helix bundle protein